MHYSLTIADRHLAVPPLGPKEQNLWEKDDRVEKIDSSVTLPGRKGI